MLSPYEKERQQNIERNKKILQELNIPQLVTKKPSLWPRERKRKREVDKTQLRRSARLRGITEGVLEDDEIMQMPHKENAEVITPSPPRKITGDIKIEGVPNHSEFVSLIKNSVYHSEDSQGDSEESESVSESIDNSKYAPLTVAAFKKVVPDRIYCLSVFPSKERILCAVGDKLGRIGIWNYGTVDKVETEHDVVVYHNHRQPLTGLMFPMADGNRLYSCSYEGSIRCMDLEKEMSLETYSNDEELTCLDVTPDANTIYCSCKDGTVVSLDVRSGQSSKHTLHKQKISTVSINPVTPNVIATSSNDRTVRVWDARKMDHATEEFVHLQAVASCAYSRVTGEYLVSVSYDDLIRVWETNKLNLKFSHNNHTGRWITPFRVNFDPKHDDLFVVGNMKRAVEVFSAADGKHKAFATDENLTAIPAINAFHPFHDIVFSATASGRTYAWKQS